MIEHIADLERRHADDLDRVERLEADRKEAEIDAGRLLALIDEVESEAA